MQRDEQLDHHVQAGQYLLGKYVAQLQDPQLEAVRCTPTARPCLQHKHDTPMNDTIRWRADASSVLWPGRATTGCGRSKCSLDHTLASQDRCCSHSLHMCEQHELHRECASALQPPCTPSGGPIPHTHTPSTCNVHMHGCSACIREVAHSAGTRQARSIGLNCSSRPREPRPGHHVDK